MVSESGALLIPAIEQVCAGGALPGWIPAAAGMLAGTAFLAGMDGLMFRPRQDRSLLMTAITLHNIPEGMAVGLAFALAESGESLAGAVALAVGIGVQNFPEGAAIALPLRQQLPPPRCRRGRFQQAE